MTKEEIIQLDALLVKFHEEMNKNPPFSFQSYYATRLDVLDQIAAFLPE